jgi:hypothetical protein
MIVARLNHGNPIWMNVGLTAQSRTKVLLKLAIILFLAPVRHRQERREPATAVVAAATFSR